MLMDGYLSITRYVGPMEKNIVHESRSYLLRELNDARINILEKENYAILLYF